MTVDAAQDLSPLGLAVEAWEISASDGRDWASCVPRDEGSESADLASSIRDLISDRDFSFLTVGVAGDLSEAAEQIISAVDEASGGRPVLFWQTAGEFVTPDVAEEFWMLTAGGSWHAFACWLGRLAPSGRVGILEAGTESVAAAIIDRGVPPTEGPALIRLTAGASNDKINSSFEELFREAPEQFVIGGSSEATAAAVVERVAPDAPQLRVSKLLGPELSSAPHASALARLAEEIVVQVGANAN